MGLDLLALGILVAAAAVGFVRGWLVSSVRFGGALAAYVGAWVLGPRLAPLFESRGLSGMLAVAMGGLAVFLVLLVAVEIVAALVKAAERRRRGGQARTGPDRAGGALVGALAGAAFAVLVAWLGITVDALRTQTGNEALPSVEGSRLVPVARSIIRHVGEWALADQGPAGAAVARAAADPADAMARVERLLGNPHLVSLREDRGFWHLVENGRYRPAVERASFLALAYDGTTRRELAELGLISEEAAASSLAFRDAAVDALAAVGPRIQAVRQDPALGRLAEDPAVHEMVMANDTLGLLRHPDVRLVIARALAGPAPAAGS
jgi:uncharacterized membrane protein required for colicin V production